jgi:hypothetical protein
VGPLFIVVAAPGADLLFSILQAQKPVLIQAFLPKTAVKRFDEGVVRGLAWPGKVQNQGAQVPPQSPKTAPSGPKILLGQTCSVRRLKYDFINALVNNSYSFS